MRGLIAALMLLVLMIGSAGAVITGISVEETFPSRGNFATHDAGNFTLIIDDDGGSTGWDTLEFPPGEDRLYDAYFGMGTGSDSVDFGKNTEFKTKSAMNISSPGNHTDEEGFCSFSGWPGEDFQSFTITQRTFVNRYEENTRGHTGRWMVVDYEIDGPQITEDHIYFLQTMNIDLGASPDDDRFSFLADINTTVISQGSTFVGVGYFSMSDSSYFFGHNAGPYGPSVYSSESAVWGQMSSPNNLSSSSTEQDWYMDISARVPSADTASPFHVSFIVAVGSDHHDIRGAYNDAANALRGSWSGPVIEEWVSKDQELIFDYHGPYFPPEDMMVVVSSREMEGDWGDGGLIIPEIIPGTRGVSVSINTTSWISDWGEIQWYISSRSVFGYFDSDAWGSFDVDNKGPTTTLSYVNDAPTGTLTVETSTDDRGGSGTSSTGMSMDGEHFVAISQIEIYDDGSGIDIYARSIDNAGNTGTTVSLTDLINDGTPPTIENLATIPDDLDDKTTGPVTVEFLGVDAISGIDTSSGEISYSIGDTRTFPDEWIPATHDGEKFVGIVDLNLTSYPGQRITINARVRDMIGNIAEASITDHIDQINDLPEYSMFLANPDDISNEIGLHLLGEDPDGDDVTFTFQYSFDDIQWMEMPEDRINFTDNDHVLIKAPDVEYEGDLFLTGRAHDREGYNPMNRIVTKMDRKAPVIDPTDLPPVMTWITSPEIFRISATDGVSGLFSTWYLEDDGAGIELRTSSNITFSNDGIFTLTVFAQDRLGNTRELALSPVKVDMGPPVIHNISISPDEPVQGDDLTVSFNVEDNFGFDHDKISSDPSMNIFVELVYGQERIEANRIVPGSESGKYSAHFPDPFTDINILTVRMDISVFDDAGNRGKFISDDLNIKRRTIPDDLPFEVEFPASVDTGKAYSINITHDGPVILEITYPDTGISWIISPGRIQGRTRSYDLPGCFRDGEISFIVHYGEENSGRANMSSPQEDPFLIDVTGFVDTDGDGLPDIYEIKFGLDPNSKDFLEEDKDGDGLDLLGEMIFLTDPQNSDSDGDGMDDGWEARYGTLPFRDDRTEDPDDDGWPNHREYEERTDPRNPEDHPEEIPATPWYWIALIVLVLLAILIYFVIQMFNRRKLEDDLEAMEEEMDWDREQGKKR